MKKLNLLIVLAVFFLGSTILNAQIVEKFNGTDQYPPKAPEKIQDLPSNKIPVMKEDAKIGKTKDPGILAFQSDTIDIYSTAIYTHLSRINPVAYDPASGAIYVAGMQREYDTISTDPLELGDLKKLKVVLRISSDGGNSWMMQNVFDYENFGGTWPSIIVNNSEGATNPADIPFAVYSVFVERNTATGEWPFKGGLVSEYYDQSITPAQFNQTFEGGYRWSSGKFNKVDFGGGQVAGFSPQVLTREASSSAQYGKYGLFGYDLTSHQQVEIDVTPSVLTLDKFIQNDDPDRSYNGPIEMTSDDMGNIYLALNAGWKDMNPPSQLEIRLPSVTKSTDGGNTWEEVNILPETVYNNYGSDQGYPIFNVYGPYNMEAFIATGEDQYSYFFRMGFYNADEQLQEVHIVEARYDNGAWSLNKITELSGTPFVLYFSSDFENTLRYASHPLGNEIQVARTADGENIVLKWIDPVTQFEIDPPIPISFINNQTGNEQMDQLGFSSFNDVFSCYRSVDETTWSEPQNITDDPETNYKCTWIPPVVPNISNIPMTHLHTIDVTNEEHWLYGTPQEIVKNIAAITQYVMYGSYELEPSAVAEGNTGSFKFQLEDIYPNPVTGNAEIGYSLEKGANTKIELYNSMGQLVDVLQEGYSTAGFHGLNVNTSEYATGMYYYTLTVEGKKLTKIMSIAH